MGFPAQLDHTERNHPSNDTVSHFILHEVQLILRLIVAASIIATVVMMVSIFYWAFVPAVVLLVTYLLLMITNRFEAKARAQALATGHSDAAGLPAESAARAPERDERGRILIPFWATRREATIGWEIIVGCTVSAFVLAFALLPAEWVLLGMFFIFCYMLLVMAPVWLGWITEETDREEDELRREMRRTGKAPTLR